MDRRERRIHSDSRRSPYRRIARVRCRDQIARIALLPQGAASDQARGQIAHDGIRRLRERIMWLPCPYRQSEERLPAANAQACLHADGHVRASAQ